MNASWLLRTPHFARALLLAAPLLLAHCGGTGEAPGSGGGGGDTCAATNTAAPPPSALTCRPESPAWAPHVVATIRQTFTGDNGTFTDHCASCDTLVKYTCEEGTECDNEELCEPSVTGDVIPMQIACPCVDGRCVTGCPEQGDKMHVEAVVPNGKTTLVHDATGKKYACNSNPECPWTWVEGEVSSLSPTSVCTAGTGAWSLGSCTFEGCALVP